MSRELQDGGGVVRVREKGRLEGDGAPCFLVLSKKQTHGREQQVYPGYVFVWEHMRECP